VKAGKELAYDYFIDTAWRLVVSTASGRLTFTDIKAHEDRLVSDPNFNPAFNHFVDGEGVTDLDISIDEAKTLARRTLFSLGSRRAFFAPSPALYGTLRLMSVHHEFAKAQDNIEVFYRREQALKWLGLEGLPDPTKAPVKKPETDEAAKNEKIA